MSFDPHSLERLRELGRQLPKELPNPKTSQKEESPPTPNSKRHRVEIEENPQALFHELIKVSSEVKVPTHLISRLKEVESKQLLQEETALNKVSQKEPYPLKNTKTTNKQVFKKSHLKAEIDEHSLYASFTRLLLEEEDI